MTNIGIFFCLAVFLGRSSPFVLPLSPALWPHCGAETLRPPVWGLLPPTPVFTREPVAQQSLLSSRGGDTLKLHWRHWGMRFLLLLLIFSFIASPVKTTFEFVLSSSRPVFMGYARKTRLVSNGQNVVKLVFMSVFFFCPFPFFFLSLRKLKRKKKNHTSRSRTLPDTLRR